MATVRDFLNECEMYEYSQRNYEMMNDILALEMAERYIKNYENALQMEADGVLTESYAYFLAEADSADKVVAAAANAANTAINTKVGQKAIQAYADQQPKLVGKIIEFIKWICRNVLGFFNKADELVAKINANSSTLLSRISQVTLNQADVDKLYNILSAGKSINFTDILKVKQPFENSLSLRFDLDVKTDEKLKTVKWLLSIVLSDTTVAIAEPWLAAMRGNDVSAAVTQEKLIPILSDFISATSAAKFANIKANLETASLGKNKYLVIATNNDTISANGKKLKELQPKVENIQASEFDTPNSDGWKQINDDVTYVKTAMMQSIHMYDIYTKYRSNTIAKIKAFLDEHARIEAPTKEGEKE